MESRSTFKTTQLYLILLSVLLTCAPFKAQNVTGDDIYLRMYTRLVPGKNVYFMGGVGSIGQSIENYAVYFNIPGEKTGTLYKYDMCLKFGDEWYSTINIGIESTSGPAPDFSEFSEGYNLLSLSFFRLNIGEGGELTLKYTRRKIGFQAAYDKQPNGFLPLVYTNEGKKFNIGDNNYFGIDENRFVLEWFNSMGPLAGYAGLLISLSDYYGFTSLNLKDSQKKDIGIPFPYSGTVIDENAVEHHHPWGFYLGSSLAGGLTDWLNFYGVLDFEFLTRIARMHGEFGLELRFSESFGLRGFTKGFFMWDPDHVDYQYKYIEYDTGASSGLSLRMFL